MAIDNDNDAGTMDTAQDEPVPASETLENHIRRVLNCHSAENASDTPDFILAEYLIGCLNAYDQAVRSREKWYGRREFV